MNISKTKIDDLNAVIKIEIEGKDYESKVESVLNNYRKKSEHTRISKRKCTIGYHKETISKGCNSR